MSACAVLTFADVLLQLDLEDSATDHEKMIASEAVSRAEAAVAKFIGYDPTFGTRTKERYPVGDYGATYRGSVWDVNDTHAYQRPIVGGSSNQLFVRTLPIRSITSLWVDYDGRFGQQTGAFGASTLKIAGTDYWPEFDGQDSDGNDVCLTGAIRSHGLWPTSPGTVQITYVGGYTPAELDGRDTVIDASPIREGMLIEAVRRTKGSLMSGKVTTAGGSSLGFTASEIVSERLGDYSYSKGGATGSRGSTYDRNYGNLYGLTQETQQLLRDYVNYGHRLAG